jgi:tRNA1(Val) A37 N6-methylase TrmN6
VTPRAGEDLCYLSGDWRILQRRDGHRWSLDDLVTAWFATLHVPPSPSRILDLGCGIGSVLLMLAWRYPQATVLGVEVQDVSVDLARRSIAWNGAEQRCHVLRADFRDPALLDALGTFDVVTGTPPYLAPGTARESRRPQRGPCTFEHRGGVDAYATVAARLLAPTGVFVTCAQAAQAARVEAAARLAGLVITHAMGIVPRAGKAPLLALFAMRRPPAAGGMRWLPVLVVREIDGARTPACRALRTAMGLPP